MPIEQPAEQPASEQTRAAERRQRHSDGACVDMRDLGQERLDIAIARVIASCHEHRDHIERDEERVLEQLGQLLERKTLARWHGGEHRGLVDDRDSRQRSDHGKRHTPAHGQANGATERQAEDLCDGRARSDHADGERAVARVNQTRGHNRGD